MRIFRYEVCYYSEYEDAEVIQKGIVCGENYADAMRQLTADDGGYTEEICYAKLTDCYDAVITDSDLAIDLRK